MSECFIMKYNITWMAIILINSTNICKCNDNLINTYIEMRKYEKEYDQDNFEDDLLSDKIIMSHNWDDVTIKNKINDSCQKHNCFFMYNMLLFMYLVHPENYFNNDNNIIDSIENACPNWEQKMLKARINTNHFKASSFSNVNWMFYFYTNQMKQLAVMDNDEKKMSIMEKLHRRSMGYVKSEIQVCHKYIPKSKSGSSIYDGVMNSEHYLALDALKLNCKRLKITETGFQDLDFERLYLNNIIEDNEIMDTLTNSFGVLVNSSSIIDLLSSKMKSVKNPMTSLYKVVSSLKCVHIYFIQMLKTIMLRALWTLLKLLKLFLKNIHRKPYIYSINGHLKNFANFFELNSEDDFRKLINELNTWAKKPSFTFSNPMSTISRLLKNYDKYEPRGKMGNDNIVMEKMILTFSELKVSKKNLNDDTESLADIENKIGETIDWAQNLVDYLKGILEGVNFIVIQGFISETFLVEEMWFDKYSLTEMSDTQS